MSGWRTAKDRSHKRYEHTLRTTAPARPRHARPATAARRLIRRGVAASTASTAALAASSALGFRRRRRRAVPRWGALRERGDGRRNDGKVSGRRRNDVSTGRGTARRRGGRATWRRRPAAATRSRQGRICRRTIAEKSNSSAALGINDDRRSKSRRHRFVDGRFDRVNINRVVRPPPKTGDGRAVVEEQSRLRR